MNQSEEHATEVDDNEVRNDVIKGEVEKHVGEDVDETKDESAESIESPGKVMRIGTMTKQLLEEVREAPLDERSRTRLREIYETSVKELAEGVSPDLREELDRLISPFANDSIPSDAELRIAQAQLVGWLEGLFHGIQATLFAQQMAARGQLEQVGQRGIAQRNGLAGSRGQGGDDDDRPGTYL